MSKKLLAVLDMTEGEQRIVIGSLLDKHHSHKTKCVDWTGSTWTVEPCKYCSKTWEDYNERQRDKSKCKGNRPYLGSLANLAFRLRDEVSSPDWQDGLIKVYKHRRLQDIEKYEEGCPFEPNEWALYFAGEIDWIIAALIAKQNLSSEEKEE